MSEPPHTVTMQTLPISELIRIVAAADMTVRPFHAIHNRLRPERMSASISAKGSVATTGRSHFFVSICAQAAEGLAAAEKSDLLVPDIPEARKMVAGLGLLVHIPSIAPQP